MNSKKYDVERELEEWFSDAEKVVVAGIGNPIRMDDFVGTRIAQDLHGKVSKRVYLIECETLPENFIQEIIDFNPTHVLLIDAAILDLKPGDSRIVEPQQLPASLTYSTHGLPLRIFCEYLARTTKAKIALLLIEPRKVEFGEGLTPKLEASAQDIVSRLLRVLP